jgi:pectinesterase
MKFRRIAVLTLWLAAGLLPEASHAQSLSEELIQQADIIVDISGNGDYTSVQEGINAIPDDNDQWLVLLVKKGIYHEKVILNYKKTKVILVGEDVDSTIITHDDWGDKMLVDGDPARGGHTFSTYTFRADPHDFQAYNITFENPTRQGQGVAYHSNGDRQILHHCRLIGYQDTYFDNFRTRRYIQDCFIEGKTDYIFGFGVTLFDSCQIHMVETGGYMTAAATPEHYEFGYVFKDCRLTAAPGVGGFYLGRPWFPYSNTLFYECWEPESLAPTGWGTWSGRESTCIYREYNCFGPGSDTANRVDFGRQLDPSLAPRYLTDTILAASNFPSDMGELVDSVELWSMRNRFEESGYVARADTVLYAGRDTFPEYPTEDWSPEFYEPIHSVLTKYTVPFMDSINGVLEIENLFWNGQPLEGFHPDSLEYVVVLPPGDTLPPVFRATGTGVFTSTRYPADLIGRAIVSVTSRDKVNGTDYRVYISKDSAYWSTTPTFAVINWKDTLYFEKGVFQYDYYLPAGNSKVSSVRIVGLPELTSSNVRPGQIPGDIVVTAVSPSRTDTAEYRISVHFPLGIDEGRRPVSSLEILNPVTDRLLLKSSVAIPGKAFVTVYDVNGRLVFNEDLVNIQAGLSEIPMDSGTMSPGVYLYSIQSRAGNASGRLVKYN